MYETMQHPQIYVYICIAQGLWFNFEPVDFRLLLLAFQSAAHDGSQESHESHEEDEWHEEDEGHENYEIYEGQVDENPNGLGMVCSAQKCRQCQSPLSRGDGPQGPGPSTNLGWQKLQQHKHGFVSGIVPTFISRNRIRIRFRTHINRFMGSYQGFR